MPAPNKRRGFTLMEVAIAIAVMAILAGTAIPLIWKNVSQAKEQRVRQEMRQLFEGCFGAQERIVANARVDWGYDPGLALGGSTNLAKLSTRTAPPVPTLQAWGTAGAAPFNWGWNGPYWSGATTIIGGNRVPADPWGRAYLLRRVGGGTPGYQILCTGSNGVNNTPAGNPVPQGDDLVYPITPLQALPSGQVTVSVQNTRLSSAPVPSMTVTVQIWSRQGTWTQLVATQTQTIAAGAAGSWAATVAPGGIAVIVTPPSGPAFTVPATVASGELRSLTFAYN